MLQIVVTIFGIFAVGSVVLWALEKALWVGLQVYHLKIEMQSRLKKGRPHKPSPTTRRKARPLNSKGRAFVIKNLSVIASQYTKRRGNLIRGDITYIRLPRRCYSSQ